MNRTSAALARSRWTARAGLWAVLTIMLASGVPAPAGTALCTGLASGPTLVAAESPATSAEVLGNGWGG